ncbi:MAG: TIGR00374 family protein, partial [Symploca sp. SIO2B6]|nr:TIGR00374 family protein [Symploca sp. SIO2B6]
MKRFSVLGLLVGLALLTLLVTWQGWTRITEVLQVIGWRVVWLPTYFLVPLGCALLSWWYLFPPNPRPRLTLSAYCTWINFAVNWLLPVAQVGGELARIRLLIKRKFPPGEAIASVVGDQTLQIISQALYALMGVILLTLTQSHGSTINLQKHSLPLFLLVGGSLVVLTLISAGLYWLQHQGLFQLFSKIARKFPAFGTETLNAQATTLDEAIMAMYQRRDRLLIATLWRIGFRLLAAGETWLTLRFLGYPVGLIDALILESLGQAVRSAAFLLPGGLGAQEGGLMAIGAVLGIPINLGLSLSLC